MERSKVVAGKVIGELKKLSGSDIQEALQEVLHDPEIGLAFRRLAEEFRTEDVTRNGPKERSLVAEVLPLSPKEFKIWLEEKDEEGTKKSIMKKAFSKWLAGHYGKELTVEASQEFNEAVKVGMDRLRVRFECPKCGNRL